MANATLKVKPDAGNSPVRFDKGEVVSAKLRRGLLLYVLVAFAGVCHASSSCESAKFALNTCDNAALTVASSTFLSRFLTSEVSPKMSEFNSFASGCIIFVR